MPAQKLCAFRASASVSADSNDSARHWSGIDAHPELPLAANRLEPRFQPQREEQNRMAIRQAAQRVLGARELVERLPQAGATGVERLDRLLELAQASFGAALAALDRFARQQQRVVRLLAFGPPAHQFLACVVEAGHQLSFGSISLACTAISTGTW